jgi:nucleotide-binding universal stress UspA family protein
MTRVWRIVAGVDGSSASVEALRWAADEARLRGSELTVVHAWLDPETLYPAPYAPARARPSPDEAYALAGARLTAAVSQVFGPEPHVKLHEVLARGPATRVLLDEAASADLLVLGGHRSDTPLRHTAGAVARGCLRRAPCPVVIVCTPGLKAGLSEGCA